MNNLEFRKGAVISMAQVFSNDETETAKLMQKMRFVDKLTVLINDLSKLPQPQPEPAFPSPSASLTITGPKEYELEIDGWNREKLRDVIRNTKGPTHEKLQAMLDESGLSMAQVGQVFGDTNLKNYISSWKSKSHGKKAVSIVTLAAKLGIEKEALVTDASWIDDLKANTVARAKREEFQKQ